VYRGTGIVGGRVFGISCWTLSMSSLIFTPINTRNKERCISIHLQSIQVICMAGKTTTSV